MSGVACVTPIKNPTPSAMIAMMAMNRPKLVLNSFAMFLLNLRIMPSAQSAKAAPPLHTPPIAARRKFYHSMVDTSAGFSCTISDSTRPFLTWMTLSAICVMAWLCVMTMTVFFPSRQISCNNFRMLLPVS